MTIQNNLQELWNDRVLDLGVFADIPFDLADAILNYESCQYNYTNASKYYSKLSKLAKKYNKTIKECRKYYDDFRSEG